MTLRALIGVGLAGTAAWLVLRRLATTLPAGSLQGPSGLPWPAGDPSQDPGSLFGPFDFGTGVDSTAPASSRDFTSITVARESSGDPLAKNPNSSASGLYQFTKSTWQSVGGAWGSDPTKAFGGLTPSAAEQTMRFNLLTQQNANGLLSRGIAATNGALYAAHFLGLPTALRVLTAPVSASLASLVGSAVMKANPQLTGFTVGDFRTWLEGRA